MPGGDLSLSNESKPPVLILDERVPTLFVDYDGVLHRGHAFLDESNEIFLDTGIPLFEFSPLLVSLLEPWPEVEIVLTTTWLSRLPVDEVVSYLPLRLARRVVGTTQGYRARFGDWKTGIARTYIIRAYVFEHRLRNWLAIVDSVYGAHDLSTDFLALEPHLVLLDSQRGIGEAQAQQRIRDWLAEVHGADRCSD